MYHSIGKRCLIFTRLDFLLAISELVQKLNTNILPNLSLLYLLYNRIYWTIFACLFRNIGCFISVVTEHYTKNEKAFINSVLTVKSINKNRNISIKPLKEFDILSIFLKTHCILNGFHYNCKYIFITDFIIVTLFRLELLCI